MITQLEDLNELKNLSALHLRDNKIEALNGFSESMESLQYINLRGNVLTTFDEIKKLHILPKLRALVLLDNPLTENSDYRLEVLISVRRLERLDKDEYIEDERTEAEEIHEQRRIKEQEAALESNNDEANNEDGEDAEKNDNNDD